jgi:ABC-type nitrate/sulfonate/bicarbonate transport system permease component
MSINPATSLELGIVPVASSGKRKGRISVPKAPGKRARRARSTLLGVSSLVLVVLLWQLEYSLKLVQPLFLPSPAQVADAIGNIVTSSGFLTDLKVSGEEFGIGLGLSIVVGAVLGILSGWYRDVDDFLRPLVSGLNSMPHLAVIPLLILIFGIGMVPKVIVVMLSCIVVILMNTASGVQNVDRHLLRLARSFCASDWAVIRTVVLPSVVPSFMTGVRISVGRAVSAVVLAEIFASRAGLGNIIINAQSAFNMPTMYAAVIILTLIGILLTQLASRLEQRLQRWQT